VVKVHQIGIALHYYGGTVTAGKGISQATGGPIEGLQRGPDLGQIVGRGADDELIAVSRERALRREQRLQLGQDVAHHAVLQGNNFKLALSNHS
jgi:hypothetical protein